MNPTLIEYFAAHETLADFMSPDGQGAVPISIAGENPDKSWDSIPAYEWQARWMAKLRFIRAKAMAEEAERIRAESPCMSPEQKRQTEEVSRLFSEKPQDTLKTSNLSFGEAMEAMKAGKKVKRRDWILGHLEANTTLLHATATGVSEYELKDVGIENSSANDWEILP
jgi:hypothetical protein